MYACTNDISSISNCHLVYLEIISDRFYFYYDDVFDRVAILWGSPLRGLNWKCYYALIKKESSDEDVRSKMYFLCLYVYINIRVYTRACEYVSMYNTLWKLLYIKHDCNTTFLQINDFYKKVDLLTTQYIHEKLLYWVILKINVYML